jgi:O-methyltransferase
MTAATELANCKAYIELIKRSVTNYLYLGGEDEFRTFSSCDHYDPPKGEWRIDPLARPLSLLDRRQLALVETSILSLESQGVPGDYIEAGVWRGGVIILMRALLNAYGIADRRIVAADSFAGIPMNVRFRHDPVDAWPDRWVASLEEVRAAIARFDLLDDRIEFLPGYFADTLHTLAGRRFALVRLDSDSYESTETSLVHLYPLLSKGGVLIIDDWHLTACKMAVSRYRTEHGIEDPILTRGGNAYWVKQQDYGQPGPPPADGGSEGSTKV